MNNHQVFNFNGLQVRTVDKDGQPWFVLKDVCEVLDLAHRVVRQRLSDDVCSTYAIPDALGRQQETTIINEDGLYDVILESRKPEARAFRKWVTSEVLPSIRRTGSYALQPMTTAEMIAAIANQAVEQERRLAAVEKRLDDTAEILALNPTEWRRKTTALLNKIAKQRGGHEEYQNVRNESYDLLEQRANCKLAIRVTNIQKRMALEGATKSKINSVSKLDAIAENSRLTEIYLAIIKEMAIKHGVGVDEEAVIDA